MNDKQTMLITQMFDLKKLNKTCNHKNCQKYPSKEILLYEVDLITKEKKNVVSLYFCTGHYNNISKEITSKLNEIADKRWVIHKKEFDIGFITH